MGKRKNELYECVLIEGKYYDYRIGKCQVTQDLYESIMGENPSNSKGDKKPVESISFYDALVFCNKLSIKEGRCPVYYVNGKANPEEWKYKIHKDNPIKGRVVQKQCADGYRLPTVEEWKWAAKEGKEYDCFRALKDIDIIKSKYDKTKAEYDYSGSNNIDEVAWYEGNSGGETHEVGQKKPNKYGLYDMSGNVRELCRDSTKNGGQECCGGSYHTNSHATIIDYDQGTHPCWGVIDVGLRLVRYE